MEQVPAIELRGVSKSFPGVKALSDVSFSVKKGEVHALVGENGAGKSTLIKIMTGFHKMDEGEMLVDGKPARFDTPQQSIAAGIACIYQELSIAPLMDVAKNIFLGNWPVKHGLLDTKRLYGEAEAILERVKLDASPKAAAGELSVAQQQMVEIGRALTRSARLIIMDEPTSSLTERETQTLLALIGKLKQEGVSIIYISHKLDEVLQVSDRITVLCDGRNVTTVETRDTNRQQLIEYMLGRPLGNMFQKPQTELGPVRLAVTGLTREPVFRDVSFQVRAGEVLGFFGLVGAGRSEIMRAVFGLDRPERGTVSIDGSPAAIRSPREAVEHGLALVPEDRKNDGLALRLSVMENMSLVKLADINRGGFIDRRARKSLTERFIEAIRVKTPTPAQLAGNLSGGNQQKVVIAKWLMTEPKVLILDEPTRGIDVGSKAEIYSLIGELADKGVAVVLVSSEMNEILGVCDRVVTVFEGRLTAEFTRAQATDKAVLSAALGGV